MIKRYPLQLINVRGDNPPELCKGLMKSNEQRGPFFALALFLILTLQVIFSQDAFAYLDYGTGSYIFQVLLAIIISGLFTIKMTWKMQWQKIKNFFSNFFAKKQKP